MDLTPSDWQRVKTLFNELIELPVEQIPAALAAQCAEHPHLQMALQAMVETHLASTDQTITPQQSAASTLLDQAGLNAGDRFARYQIIRAIGAGGMGQVYLAKRDDEVVQQVAIKVLNKHSLDAQAKDRFDAERRILASLEHPNIARLIDAGTEGDQAYYVMEYVDGVPVDQYCQEHQLSLPERLQLFGQICQAVAFAHSNLIVHRDLKPGNILVTAQGEVKLLDFGIAKPLKTLPGTERVHETLVGTTALTPQYAAPEQINGQAITVSCDVYVLGLLLFRLLTDQHAFALEGKTWGEIERVINEQLPTLPSRLLRRLSAPKPNWQHKLKGDLDAIVSHALKKEPEQRYLGVRELAADIEHYLHNEPLQIKQSQTAYRLQKHLRKHWLPISALSVIFAVLITAAVMIWHQSQTIAAERDKALVEKQVAEEVTTFLVDTFKSADPTQTLGTEVTAGDILAQGVKQIDQQQVNPVVKNRLVEALGDVYRSIGVHDQSVLLYAAYLPGLLDPEQDQQLLAKHAQSLLRTDRLDQAQQLLGQINPTEAPLEVRFEAKRVQALITHGKGDFRLAQQQAEDLLSWTQSQLPNSPELQVKALINLADIMKLDQSNRKATLDLYLQAKQITEHDPNMKILDLQVTADVAAGYMKLKEYGLAEQYAAENLLEVVDIYGEGGLNHANALSSLANVYYMQDRFADSLQHRLQAIEIQQQYWDPNGTKMAFSYFNTAILFAERLQDYDQALVYYDKAFAGLQGATGKTLISLNYMKIAHSKTLIELGRYAEAEAQLLDLLAFYRPYQLKAKRNESNISLMLAVIYDQTDQPDKIIEHLEFLKPYAEKIFGPNGDYATKYRTLLDKYGHLMDL